MKPLNPDNGILFWAEKNCALGKLIGNIRPIVMVHPNALTIDRKTAHSLNIAMRTYPLCNGHKLLFLSQDHIGAPPTKDTLYSLFAHFNEWADKDQLTEDDHTIIGRHLRFGEKTIQLMLEHKSDAAPKPHQLSLDL